MYEGYYPCYLHAVDGMYATFSLNHTGGILLRWYRDQFASEEVGSAVRNGLDAYELILSRIPDGPSTVMVLPHHNGSGTPHCDLDSRGAIAGLTLATTRHEICRAILESLVFELRINRDRMSRAGIRPSECVAVGGGARSPLWLQLKADILGTPVRTLNHGDAACHGAAMLAGKAAGVYASLEQAVAAGVRYGRVFQPDPARRRTYDRRYRVYEGLYPAMKTFHHHLIRENAKFSEGSKR
jgi:xylulokinase